MLAEKHQRYLEWSTFSIVFEKEFQTYVSAKVPRV